MQKIKIFDPDKGLKGEYIDHWQCDSCNKIHIKVEDIWGCTTCKNNICDSCKDDIHNGHNAIKNDYTVSLAHDSNCNCSICDDPYGMGYYGVPVIIDGKIISYSLYDEISIGTEDSLYLLEADINPEMLSVVIPEKMFDVDGMIEVDISAFFNSAYKIGFKTNEGDK